MTIRPLEPGDVPALQTVLDETELFPGDLLPDMLERYLSGTGNTEIWLTATKGGTPVGLCYAAKEDLTDGTWNMRALAVHPAEQGHGHGAALVARLEATLKDAKGRTLIIDTSGTPGFAGTRTFYVKIGYTEEARIRDFWAPGDDKVVFWKSLA